MDNSGLELADSNVVQAKIGVWVQHSAHRLSPSETRLCAAPDLETMKTAGPSAALVTACAAHSTNQRGENLMCRSLSPIWRVRRSHKRA